MDERQALSAFAALGQAHRLRTVRALVAAGPDGLSAGALAETVGVAGNTLSFHLKELSHAGLVRSRREGKSVIYSASFAGLADLVAFLMRDCCQGRPEVCAPAVAALAACPPETAPVPERADTLCRSEVA
ncbi:ArsR/SmtB family transcription factor [Methylobacterium oryzisoli]|uniref:ArsR/SmtB family transcription factor n=1 Tax=Methylobacterium oryzisoli TaxID=3385502 RepID=UPI003891A6E3